MIQMWVLPCRMSTYVRQKISINVCESVAGCADFFFFKLCYENADGVEEEEGPNIVRGPLIFLAINLVVAAWFFMLDETWATVVGGLLVAEGIIYLIIVAIDGRRNQKKNNEGGRSA